MLQVNIILPKCSIKSCSKRFNPTLNSHRKPYKICPECLARKKQGIVETARRSHEIRQETGKSYCTKCQTETDSNEIYHYTGKPYQTCPGCRKGSADYRDRKEKEEAERKKDEKQADENPRFEFFMKELIEDDTTRIKEVNLYNRFAVFIKVTTGKEPYMNLEKFSNKVKECGYKIQNGKWLMKYR